MREIKGRAKQFTTVNGRTVVVKDNFVYSNKGGTTLENVKSNADLIVEQVSNCSIKPNC